MFGYCLRQRNDNFHKDWELGGVKIKKEKKIAQELFYTSRKIILV
jgi:hypothetical protein